MNYFISDLHFGHKNVLAFDNRPFKDIETHDMELMNRWNDAVGYDDDVYILGDISWYSPSKTIEIYENLNGIKHLIIGNHDEKMLKNRELRSLFVEITHYKKIRDDNNPPIILCHYPIPCFDQHLYGAFHLYGHVHNSFEWNITERTRYELENLYDKKCYMYNVGCMMPYMDYTPRTLEDIIAGYDRWKELGGCRLTIAEMISE